MRWTNSAATGCAAAPLWHWSQTARVGMKYILRRTLIAGGDRFSFDIEQIYTQLKLSADLLIILWWNWNSCFCSSKLWWVMKWWLWIIFLFFVLRPCYFFRLHNFFLKSFVLLDVSRKYSFISLFLKRKFGILLFLLSHLLFSIMHRRLLFLLLWFCNVLLVLLISICMS